MAASAYSHRPDETGSFKLIVRRSSRLIFRPSILVARAVRCGRNPSPAALYQCFFMKGNAGNPGAEVRVLPGIPQKALSLMLRVP